MTFQFHVRDMLNGWSGVSCFMYETCLVWSGVCMTFQFHVRDLLTDWSGVCMTSQFHVRDMFTVWSGVCMTCQFHVRYLFANWSVATSHFEHRFPAPSLAEGCRKPVLSHARTHARTYTQSEHRFPAPWRKDVNQCLESAVNIPVSRAGHVLTG